jgi:hypothetical protein
MGRLEEIKQRLLATTPGAWGKVEQDDDGDWIVSTGVDQYIAQTSYDGLSATTRETCKADAVFIAKAKADIEFLLAVVEMHQR